MYWTAIKAAHSAYKFGKAHKDKIPRFNRSHPENDMNQQPNNSFPTVPSSLSTGDYGMRGDYAAQGAPLGVQRVAPHSLEDVRPYLGLRSRLSQVWINRWTILILLVLARVLIAIGSLRTDIDHAKDKALSACNTVETLGSNMASMPHYLSDGVNELAAHGVEKAVAALYTILFGIVTAAEEIFVFWINMVYGLYECLITFAVTGTLRGVLSFADDATKFLNKTLGSIGSDIGGALTDFNKALQGFESAFNDVSSVFTGKKAPPASIDLSKEINALKSLSLPASVTDEIKKLNASIPNFDEVKNFTDSVLRLPFEEVKKLMNKSLPAYTFDKTLLPVPERTQLAFCSNDSGINNFFDKLFNLADTARKIFLATLLLAAIIACFPMGYMEIRRWRSQRTYASRMQTYATDNIDGVYIASRPWTAYGGIKLSQRFGSTRTQILVRWFVAYITSIPALVLLSLALAGLFSCLCQYAILRSVEKEVPELASDVGQFAGKVVGALNNASAEWARGTNRVINSTNNDINRDVFGWVNTSTHAVNNTLNVFVNKTIDVLNGTFGGTVLYEPIKEVYNCLIGMKVAAIEKGLTWVSDHAHIDLPMFPNDTFSAGAAHAMTTNKTTANGQNNSFLADPSDTATDKITEVVTKLANKFYDGIRTEALLATALLILYLVIVLMGLARVAYSMITGRGRSRAEGGPSYAGDVAPGTADDNTNQEAVTRGEHYEVNTPMPPPVYEPPQSKEAVSNARWPVWQRRGSDDDEEQQYQNEKMGFQHTADDHQRQPVNNPFDYGQGGNEKQGYH